MLWWSRQTHHTSENTSQLFILAATYMWNQYIKCVNVKRVKAENKIVPRQQLENNRRRPAPITDPQHTPDLTLALNKSLPEVKPNWAFFRSTVAASLSSCSDYLHPSNNTAAWEDPRAGRRCPFRAHCCRRGGGDQWSSRIGQTRSVPGGEGLKLLLPAGNEYLNNSGTTSNMCYITLHRTRP